MLIKHSTFISCPADHVWDATIDIDTWPDWAPTVQIARRLDRGCFGIGSQARIKQPMQSSAVWTVTAYEDGVFFAWETAGKLLRIRAAHSVAGQSGGANSTLTIKLIGPVAILSACFLMPLLWIALRQENRGLKRWCEAGRSNLENGPEVQAIK